MSHPPTGDSPPSNLRDPRESLNYGNALASPLNYDNALTFPLPDDWEDYCDEFTDADEQEWRSVELPQRPMTTVYLPGDAP